MVISREEKSFFKVHYVGNVWRHKKERQTTSTLARLHQGRNKLHTDRTMRFSNRSKCVEDEVHENHQTSDATWQDKVGLTWGKLYQRAISHQLETIELF